MAPSSKGGKGGPPGKKGFVALLEKKKILTGVPPATEADLARVKQMLDGQPDSKDLLEWYAFLLYTLNHVNECLKVYDKLVAQFTPSAEALYYYGCAHLKSSNFRAANAAWTMLKKKHPDSGMVSRVSKKQEVLRELVGAKKKKPKPQLAIKGLLKNIGAALSQESKSAKKKSKTVKPKPAPAPAPKPAPKPEPKPLFTPSNQSASSPIDRLSILDKLGAPSPPKAASDLPPLPDLADFQPARAKAPTDLPPLPNLDDFQPASTKSTTSDLPPLPDLDDFQPTQPEPEPEQPSAPQAPPEQPDNVPAMLGAEKDDVDDASPASLLDHFLASVEPDDWAEEDDLMMPPVEEAPAVDMLEIEQTAYIHLGKGDLDKAADLYEQILSIEAAHPIALYYLGDIMYSKGKDSKAMGHWNKLVALHPEHELAKKAEKTLALIKATTFG